MFYTRRAEIHIVYFSIVESYSDQMILFGDQIFSRSDTDIAMKLYISENLEDEKKVSEGYVEFVECLYE